ncbi:MAG: tetratricopeptide repeat protein [Planctomycetota bacterium]
MKASLVVMAALVLRSPAGALEGAQERGTAEALPAQAGDAMGSGEVDLALRLYERAAALDPADAALLAAAGYAAYCLDRLDQAETFFRRALLITPGDAYALRMLGHIALARGDFLAAIAHYEDLLGLHAGDVAAADALALARERLAELHDLASSRRRLETALAAVIAAWAVLLVGSTLATRRHDKGCGSRPQ